MNGVEEGSDAEELPEGSLPFGEPAAAVTATFMEVAG
jgi:hypothetical protein